MINAERSRILTVFSLCVFEADWPIYDGWSQSDAQGETRSSIIHTMCILSSLCVDDLGHLLLEVFIEDINALLLIGTDPQAGRKPTIRSHGIEEARCFCLGLSFQNEMGILTTWAKLFYSRSQIGCGGIHTQDLSDHYASINCFEFHHAYHAS